MRVFVALAVCAVIFGVIWFIAQLPRMGKIVLFLIVAGCVIVGVWLKWLLGYTAEEG